MSVISLPERWILERYIKMLHRVLHAARAHATHTYPFVVDRLSEGISFVVPDAYTADADAIQRYLNAVSQVILDTRYACNELFDRNDKPYRLIQSTEPGESILITPGCEAAMSLLDAVDDHVPQILMNWGLDFWCRPRTLYDRLREHEIRHESGLGRFTGFLNPAEIVAPAEWRCDTSIRKDRPGS